VTDSGEVRPQDLLRVTTLQPHGSAGTTLLEVVGEVDLLSASVLEDAIATALRSDPAVLVIDLTGVSFLASLGISALVKARRTAGSGTSVRVVAPERSVSARALELMGLIEALAVVPVRTEALAR
jgi:anti-anti-sigma factor